MKYIVMKCTQGYAVLMDEEGRYVFAANLGYKVGQTVTDPVIMADLTDNKRGINIVLRTVAAAACVIAVALPCYGYYTKNLKTYSTVTITSDAAISMEINSSGKVIRLKSDTEYGREIIRKIDIKGKNQLEAANEILQTELSEGYISAGDTVDVYIDGNSSKECENIKSKLEEELPKHDIKVNIHDEKVPAIKGEKEPVIKEEKVKNENKLPHEKPTIPTPSEPVTEAKVNIKPTASKPDEAVKPAIPDDEPIPETPTEPAKVPDPPVEEDAPPHSEKQNRPVHEPPQPDNREPNNENDIKPEPPMHKDGDLPHERIHP